MDVRNKTSEISSLHLAKLVNAQHKNLKTFAVPVYGHVIWSYKEAKIKSPIFYDFSLIDSL